MFCQKCGMQAEPSYRFCQRCGAPLDSSIYTLSTSRLYFSILNPGGDFKFDGWSIDGAKGYDMASTED